MPYNPQKFEAKWQKIWARKNLYSARDFDKKPKKYVLDMFPYPSGEGLHVGHVEGYTASDIYSRYLRMKGYNVLHPMGWDAFGLPAENYAIKNKIHPAIVVKKNIQRFKKQLSSIGFAYDWQREINTTDPEYYRWTQWIFLKLFENGLAYEAEAPINWCPSCKTGLANEEVIEGECERCGTEVGEKKLRQWLLKITAYADRLLKDLDQLDWPEKIKTMQRNWIGKSEGAIIKFLISNSKFQIPVFTTRADTLFGATYVVLAPENSLIENLKLKIENWDEVNKYIKKAQEKSDLQRTDLTKEKTGIELKGVKAINPVNNQKIPVWISDYVLATYGTGAIMAVPAHDQRDFEFALRYNLPVKMVIDSGGKLKAAYEGEGVLVNSGKFSGTNSEEAKEKIVKWLAEKDLAQKKINYKLRDWLFSRQRYWGEPIPLVFCKNCKKEVENPRLRQDFGEQKKFRKFSKGELLNPGWIAVPEDQLPIKLPKVKYYEPTETGQSPLANIKNWINTKCPRCGNPAKRETNTMPQWAGSNWYYIAYLIRENSKFSPFEGSLEGRQIPNSKKLKYWLPVDVYVGGVEHAVLHLLYARFWHKFLYDIGIVPTKEPFQKLINQGLILGPDHQKMSKSRGNIINPDDVMKIYGADSLRMYEMFMGPLEDVKPWNTRGIVGVYRFLQRAYSLISKSEISRRKVGIPTSLSKNINEASGLISKQIPNSESEIQNFKTLLHKTIKKITEDIEDFRFNTAVSALMILINEMASLTKISNRDLEILSKLLAPFAPHLVEELWRKLGHKKSIHLEKWPKYDKKLIQEKTFELVVQINGKVRDKFKASVNISEKETQNLSLQRERIKQLLSNKKIKKIIIVPQKLINFVI